MEKLRESEHAMTARLTDEELDITTADMLEIVASGGNGGELVELPAIMSKAAKELREKDARIAELEAALAKAKETADAEFTAKLRYRDERFAAEAEVKRLREALEYYASQYCESPGFDGCGECEPHDCDGCRARAALGREG
jgi:hypothetical protein